MIPSSPSGASIDPAAVAEWSAQSRGAHRHQPASPRDRGIYLGACGRSPSQEVSWSRDSHCPRGGSEWHRCAGAVSADRGSHSWAVVQAPSDVRADA